MRTVAIIYVLLKLYVASRLVAVRLKLIIRCLAAIGQC